MHVRGTSVATHSNITHAPGPPRSFFSPRAEFLQLTMPTRSRANGRKRAVGSPSPAHKKVAGAVPDAAPTIVFAAEEIDSDSEEVGWTAEDEGKTVWRPPAGYNLTHEQVVFKRKIDRKFYLGILLYLAGTIAATMAAAHGTPPPEDKLAAASASAAARLQLTAACSLGTLYWVFRTVIFDAPPEPKDDSWSFLQACPAGRFIWLTIHIDAAQLCYWFLALVVESEVLLTPSLPPDAAAIAKDLHWGLLSVLHAGAVFVWSLSFMLAALFMKFCWFEENWHRDVLEARRQRGVPNPGYSYLLGHLAAFPLSLVDLFCIKDATLMAYYRPAFSSIAWVGLVYGLLYFGWMHANHRLCGLWPYPFCEKLFATKQLQAAFVGGVSFAMAAVSYVYYTVSVALGPGG